MSAELYKVSLLIVADSADDALSKTKSILSHESTYNSSITSKPMTTLYRVDLDKVILREDTPVSLQGKTTFIKDMLGVDFFYESFKQLPPPPGVWIEDLSTGFLKLFERLTNGESINIISDRFPFENVIRLYLNRNTSRATYRTEIIANHLPADVFVNSTSAVMGGQYWYSFKVFLPAEFLDDYSPEVIGQWHATEDPGDDGISPVVAFYTSKSPGSVTYDRLSLFINRSTDPVTNWSTYLGSTEYVLGPLSSFRGKWTEWTMQVKWSYKQDGRLVLWKDGVQVVHHRGANCYNDKLGPKFHIGVYKWTWDSNNPAYIGTTDPLNIGLHQTERMLYLKDLRFGDERANLQSMSSL